MTTGEPPVPEDPLAEAAALIRDVGRSAQQARRYRELATTLAEPIFERALAIGSDVRRAARSGDTQPSPAVSTAIAELKTLLARCESAIAGVKNGAIYQEAAAAFAAGAMERIGPLVATIFTDVMPYLATGTLYWSVPIGGERSGPHFIPPEELAARLRAIASEGLRVAGPPPELGGDETIHPLCLTEQHDDADSPIALAFEPQVVPGPVCHLAGTDIVLVYAQRLQAEFTVSCSARADDEWWAVRPDAYRSYVEALRAALSADALRVVLES